MENRKNNYTPRDRIDDALLLQLLRENEPSSSNYGKYETRDIRATRVRNNIRYNEQHERKDSDESCLCNHECAETTSTCGCRRDTERGTRNSHGCETRKYDSANCSNRRGEYSRNRMSRNLPCDYNDSPRRNSDLREDARSESCGCKCGESCISDSCINKYAPAMVYTPDHDWSELYDTEEALERGTLFRVLDLPFYPTPCNTCK